jgi:hypothetical protein
MSEQEMGRSEAPATVEQIAAAMAALGLYDGENTPEEHAAEAARLGGEDAYRVRMVNALLGVVQAEAAMADVVRIDPDAHVAAWEEQLKAAGAGLDDPERRVEFLRWQVLRAGTPGPGDGDQPRGRADPAGRRPYGHRSAPAARRDRREPGRRRSGGTWRPWPHRRTSYRRPARRSAPRWTTPSCC